MRIYFDNDERKFQRKLAGDQILLTGLITIGATFLAIGSAILLTLWSILPNITGENEPKFFSSLVNVFNNLSLFYSIIGAIIIGAGFGITWYKYPSKQNIQRLAPKISIRNFSPRTYGDDDKE